ncbi:MAG TPA: DUF308 domain-containing protein [Cytophagales bacterium]|nr:DUF308 domain-containing protein [Cytophagales bacterium]
MKSFGIILIVLGIIAFIYTGFTYTQTEKVLDVGPLEVNQEKEKTVSWPPLVGIALIAGGVIAIVVDKRR